MFLVTGATGNVGAEVVLALAAAGEPVRALVRRPDAVLPDGAEAAVGDLNDPGGLDDALKGVEGVFLLSGYSDMPGMLAKARDAACASTPAGCGSRRSPGRWSGCGAAPRRPSSRPSARGRRRAAARRPRPGRRRRA